MYKYIDDTGKIISYGNALLSNYTCVELTEDEESERKLILSNAERKVEIENRLIKLSQDFVQESLGAQIDDIDTRKEEFRLLHNELRVLSGKTPRVYEVI